jgi:hypothetical protein
VRYSFLEVAMSEYLSRRHDAARLAASAMFPDTARAEDFWDLRWFPLFSIDGGMVLVIDVQDEGPAAPVRLVDWQDFGGAHFARELAPSLGEYISDALNAIDAGELVFDSGVGDWIRTSRGG